MTPLLSLKISLVTKENNLGKNWKEWNVKNFLQEAYFA